MFNDILGEDLIDEIGEYLGYRMWNKRDLSEKYDFPNSREEEENCCSGEKYVEGNIVLYNNVMLLLYKSKGCFHTFRPFYTLNLSTLQPTKNSFHKKILSNELMNKIKIKRQCN